MHGVAPEPWRNSVRTYPNRPVVVVLTGTDLYHFLASEPEATCAASIWRIASSASTTRSREPCRSDSHSKLRVIHQSARGRASRETPDPEIFEVLVVGHLRPEKDPFRTARAARAPQTDSRMRVLHLGGAHEPAWAETAHLEMRENPRYVWLGDCPPSRSGGSWPAPG